MTTAAALDLKSNQNIGPLFEISNQFEWFSPFPKITISKYLLKVIRSCIAVNGSIPWHSYRVSLAIWDHTVLLATRHKWTHRALTPGGILMMWPAIRSLLSAIMSCNLRCPVRLSTSILVTWSFHVMPKIFRRLRWWKTSSCWHILAVLFQVSLAYMAVEMMREV